MKASVWFFIAWQVMFQLWKSSDHRSGMLVLRWMIFMRNLNMEISSWFDLVPETWSLWLKGLTLKVLERLPGQDNNFPHDGFTHEAAAKNIKRKFLTYFNPILSQNLVTFLKLAVENWLLLQQQIWWVTIRNTIIAGSYLESVSLSLWCTASLSHSIHFVKL